MRIILISLFIVALTNFGCEEADLRDQQNRPSEEGADTPGFDLETIQSVEANQSATISISDTTLTFYENSLSEDAEVRLRTLKSKPEREAVASFGEAKGDVVEVTIYHKETNEVFASNVLTEQYEVSQKLSDVGNEDDLKLVVFTGSGDDENIEVVGRSALTISAGLVATMTVSMSLSVTYARLYIVESNESPASVVILTDTNGLSNDGGSTATASSSSSSTSSSSSSSSSGGTIDCSGLGHDPDNEYWIGVPANPDVGQTVDFCVMKYEAKRSGVNPNYYANSKPADAPWANIVRGLDATTAGGAISACDDLGSGYTLITNAMWQTIARNIEVAQSAPGVYLNWSNGSPSGNNVINRGHSDNNPTYALAADVTGDPDDDPCVETGQTSCGDNTHSNDFKQKRTHTLSNGEVIWDFAGNLSEWVFEDISSVQGSHGYIASYTMTDKAKWGATYDYRPNADPDPLAFEFPKTLGDYGGLGFGYLNSLAGTIVRGGSMYILPNTYTGVFFVTLGYAYIESKDFLGFRCARPVD